MCVCVWSSLLKKKKTNSLRCNYCYRRTRRKRSAMLLRQTENPVGRKKHPQIHCLIIKRLVIARSLSLLPLSVNKSRQTLRSTRQWRPHSPSSSSWLFSRRSLSQKSVTVEVFIFFLIRRVFWKHWLFTSNVTGHRSQRGHMWSMLWPTLTSERFHPFLDQCHVHQCVCVSVLQQY